MQRIHYYYVGLTGFFGLFVLLMAWHTALTPSSHLPKALLLLITVGPLLLPFKGFLNRQLKSCTWMSYLSLPYFIHGVIEAYANQNQRWISISEILFSLLLCFGAGLYVYKAEKA